MPYKDKEKRKEYDKEYRLRPEVKAKKKEYLSRPENIAKRKEKDKVYMLKPGKKELRQKYRLEHKEESKKYYQEHKEELDLKNKEYYQKNRVSVIQRTNKYHHEHKEQIKKYYKQYYAEIRLESLTKVDPAMKCAMCGCDDVRFLEVNHIKGGGRKEQKTRKNKSQNLILLIHHGKRGLEGLNLLCRVCNSVDHLERVYGHTGLRVVWEKPITNSRV